MPLPSPKKGEKQSEFISRCIAFETGASDRPANQIAAMCYTKWRDAKSGKLSEEDFNTMERYVCIGDNLAFLSQHSKKKGLSLWRKQILKYGTWKHPENSEIEFSITPEVAQQIVDNFESGIPEDAPVTLTHTDNPQGKVGRVRRFLVTEFGLDAILAVADDGVNEHIENPERAPGVSCWLDLNYKDKQTGSSVGAVVKHVALVNHPYIEGMTGFQEVQAVLSSIQEEDTFLPLVLSEKDKSKKDEAMEITKEVAIQTLKEKFNVDVETLLSASSELGVLKEKVTKGELVPQTDLATFLSDELIKKLKEMLQLGETQVDLKVAVQSLVDKLGEASTKLTESNTKLSEVQIQLNVSRTEKILDIMMSQGRVLPREKDSLIKLSSASPETFVELIEARKSGEPLIKLSGETGTAFGESDADKETKKKEAVVRNVEKAKTEGFAK